MSSNSANSLKENQLLNMYHSLYKQEEGKENQIQDFLTIYKESLTDETAQKIEQITKQKNNSMNHLKQFEDKEEEEAPYNELKNEQLKLVIKSPKSEKKLEEGGWEEDEEWDGQKTVRKLNMSKLKESSFTTECKKEDQKREATINPTADPTSQPPTSTKEKNSSEAPSTNGSTKQETQIVSQPVEKSPRTSSQSTTTEDEDPFQDAKNYFQTEYDLELKVEHGRLGTRFNFFQQDKQVFTSLIRLDLDQTSKRYRLAASLPLPKTFDRYNIKQFIEEQLLKKNDLKKRAEQKVYQSLHLDSSELRQELEFSKVDFNMFAKSVIGAKATQKLVLEIREQTFCRVAIATHQILFRKQIYLILKPSIDATLPVQNNTPNLLEIYIWKGREAADSQLQMTQHIVDAFSTQNSLTKTPLQFVTKAIEDGKETDDFLSLFSSTIRIVDGGLGHTDDIRQFCESMEKQIRLYKIISQTSPSRYYCLSQISESLLEENSTYLLDHLTHIYCNNVLFTSLPSELDECFRLGRESYTLQCISSWQEFVQLVVQKTNSTSVKSRQ